jgi:c-di-GMP-binding flagellar brake protein YcgR
MVTAGRNFKALGATCIVPLHLNSTNNVIRDGSKALSAKEIVEKANASANVDAETIVREAYLRTLSRNPNDDELAVSVEFINASEDAAEGVRGVLWALVNTREFLVNR